MTARQSFSDGFDDGEEQHEKSPKDKGMDWPRYGIAENFRLPDGDAEHTLHALIGMVETVRPFAEAEEIGQPLGIDDNPPKRGNKNDREDDDFYHSDIALCSANFSLRSQAGFRRTKFGQGWSHSRFHAIYQIQFSRTFLPVISVRARHTQELSTQNSASR